MIEKNMQYSMMVQSQRRRNVFYQLEKSWPLWADAHGGVLMTLYYDGILEQSEQNITSTVRQDEEIFHIFGGSC